MIWRLYPDALDYFYQENPDVITLPYAEHYNRFITWHLGWPTDMAHYLNQYHFSCHFITVNDQILQKKWLQEYAINKTLYSEQAIILEQVNHYKPEILWLSALFDYFGNFVQELKQYTKKIITWIGSPFVDYTDTTGLDILLTENPLTLINQHNDFNNVIVTSPGFDPSIITLLKNVKKQYLISFIGSITPAHKERLNLLTFLLEHNITIQLFSRIEHELTISTSTRLLWLTKNLIKHPIATLPTTFKTIQSIYQKQQIIAQLSTIKKLSHKPVFGLTMYKTLAASYATINPHIDCAQGYGNNMRMIEAAGSGTCLITNAANNGSLIPNKECITYQNKNELLAIIQNLAEQPALLTKIGHNAQQKILNYHTIANMYASIASVFI